MIFFLSSSFWDEESSTTLSSLEFIFWSLIFSVFGFPFWITSPCPFPSSVVVSTPDFFLGRPFSEVSSFLFFPECTSPFSVAGLPWLVATSEDFCSFCSHFWFSVLSQFSVESQVVVPSDCLGCWLAAWKARAFALCFFPSAWRRRACLLVALVLHRLQEIE